MFDVPTVLNGRQAAYCREEEPIGKGGLGLVFRATVTGPLKEAHNGFTPVSVGGMVVIKMPKVDLSYSPDQIRTFLDRVRADFEREVHALHKLGELHVAPRLHDRGWFDFVLDGVPIPVPFIVQQLIRGKDLTTYLTDRYAIDGQFRGIPTADEWASLAWKLVNRLNVVHQQEFVHRDIWPDNIFIVEAAGAGLKTVRKGDVEVVFIDFGAAVYRHQFALAPDPRRDRFVAPERKRHWLWPSRRFDIYALGGVLYIMATGLDKPPAPIEDRDALKDRVVADLTSYNPRLLAENAGIADIIARCLRYDPTERIRDADDLIQEMQLFFALEAELTLDTMVEDLTQKVNRLQKRDDLFQQMAASELFQLGHRIGSMINGILDLSGDHESIVSGLTRYMSVLRKGDQYLAVSIPEFWRSDNLGINGRFLTMNRLLAQQDVQIRRLFLVREADLKLGSDFARVAQAHLRARKECGRPENMELRYKVLDPEDFELSARNADHMGAWVHGESATYIVPVYDHDMTIRTVRLRRYDGDAKKFAQRLTQTIQGEDTHPLDERFLGAG